MTGPSVEDVQVSIERDAATWALIRDAIHNDGPVPDLIREALGLRWGAAHHVDGEAVHRPVGERRPVEPLATCAHCGRGMNPGDAMCCPQEARRG